MWGTADYADWSRLGAGYRRLDAQWKLRSLEAWKFGQAERCAAITVQAQRAKPSTAKSTTQRRAVRARKAHVRPGGPVGHGGLRTPRFGFLEVLRWSPAGLIFHERPSVTLSPRRGVLFSVLCSPFSGAASAAPSKLRKTGLFGTLYRECPWWRDDGSVGAARWDCCFQWKGYGYG